MTVPSIDDAVDNPSEDDADPYNTHLGSTFVPLSARRVTETTGYTAVHQSQR